MTAFKSNFKIGQQVKYVDSTTIISDKGLLKNGCVSGQVVAVKFTKAKVFYDILSDFYARVERDIPSDNVAK